MPRVIVSAGHTNDQPGTVVSGLREVDLTRKIAKAVVEELRKQKITTLSVPPNLELARRIQWINQTGYSEEEGDISIEIHINDGAKQGIEGWHQADKNNSINLTKSIVNQVTADLDWQSQGIKSEYEHEYGSLAFLHNTNPISSLLECGYLDNEKDFNFLKEDTNILKLAKSVAQGILNYFGPNSKNTSTTEENDNGKSPKTADDKASEGSTDSTGQTQKNIKPTPLAQSTQSDNISQTTSSSFGSTAPNSMRYSPTPAQPSYGTPPSSFSSSSPPSGSTPKPYMNREERRQMIIDNYIKILGREPSQSDLNYFLNLGTNEEQLIQKMIDSQEHADLVKSRQEVVKTKEKLTKQTNELLHLRTKVSDQQGIIKNLNQLLIQKNRAIYRLNQALRGYNPTRQPPKTQKTKPPKTFSEKMLDFFSEKLGS